MQPNPVLERLDDLIQARTILEHPFYVAWTAGELSHEQLQTYARVYYPHVAAFPGYLRSVISSAENAEVRAELQANLSEELSEPKPHTELWLDFCEGLGLDRDAVVAADKSGTRLETVKTFDRLTQGATGGAIAALYAYESQQPEVSSTKANGLRSFYGVENEETLAYFEVHAEADVRHREGQRQALQICLEADASETEVLGAASEALDAYWALLDRVCCEAEIVPS